VGRLWSESIKEAIRLTGLSKTKLYALLAEGKLKGKKHVRRTLVLMDGVRAYVDALPRARFGDNLNDVQQTKKI